MIFQKHWVESLNKMVVGSVYESLSLEETIMRSSQIISDRVVYNTASQIWNSMLCFNSLTRKQSEMGEIIAGNINASFGSYKKFVDEIHTQANTLFGGGFLWITRDKKLRVIVTANAESPIYSFKPAKGSTAADFVPAQLPKERQVILGINLWGYSYILDHELDRTKYINGVLERIDWQIVYSRFKALEKVDDSNYLEK
ncbi:hypothetical protein DSO57_1028888 [Entomophthora muscae]|uniref:Uncharacterized protein n=1 Tax=Entomophthora muscae TaxID=34485 RepID=A0ACC2TNP1_9FUNG|nr:hypothetical protein DSO57_1028888 [Entomophthora muscae]